MVYRMKTMKSASRILFPLLLLLSNALSTASAFAFTDAVVDFGIGAVAGGAGAVVAYPVDYVKCQMQTESGKTKYENGLDCFVRTVAEEGPLQLFRGVGVQVAGIAPEKSIKLSVNDIVKSMIFAQMGSLPLWGELVAASMSGLCQVVVTSPLEVLKVGLQTSDKTIPELYKDIGGFKGLFRGADACILRDIIFSATLFPIYLHGLDVFNPFVAGSVAGIAAALVTTPPDFIKTRILSQDAAIPVLADTQLESTQTEAQVPMLTDLTLPETPPFVVEYRQADGGGLLSELASNAYSLTTTNPFVVGNEIAKREGWQVMFTGYMERCVGSIPRFGVTLSLYDFLKDYAIAHHWMAAF